MIKLAVCTFISLIVAFSGPLAMFADSCEETATCLVSHDVDNEAESEDSSEQSEESEKEERKLQSHEPSSLNIPAITQKHLAELNQHYSSPYLNIFLTPPEYRA